MSASGTLLPLPGLYVVDSDGRFLASTAISSVEEVTEMLDDPAGLSPSPTEEADGAETVSIRVSGFTTAEGIT